MQTKDNVLNILYDNSEKYISGERIAAKLNISRNAVWKAVKQLKSEGYDIAASTNRGYKLLHTHDIFTAQSVCSYLKGESERKCNIEVLKSVGSTNTLLKEQAECGASEGKVIIAETQSSGKGRRGRSFFSPVGTGVYMSILLKPEIPVEKSMRITTYAAVCVSRAIENITGKHTEIKWVNDIFYNGKKIVGILTETSIESESGKLNYAVLGIGINVMRPADGFSPELEAIAGALYESERNGIRSLIAAEVLNIFFDEYSKIESGGFLEEYRNKMMLKGKTISFVQAQKEFIAEVITVDDEARLIVRLGDGSIIALSSGEVSIKKGDIYNEKNQC